ncbi:MAG TPA: hypothetical protein VIU61_24385 [Kofleriaceae bacterium]
MIRVLLASLLLATLGCRLSLEDEEQQTTGVCKTSTTNPDCIEAPNRAELAWIETNIFEKSCTFSGCHNGMATDAGRLNLKVGNSHSSLVGVASEIEPGRTLVVANQPRQSYLLVMLRHITPEMADPPVDEPPADVGYMPQNAGGAVLCCQKLDAIQRWIEAGAQNN